MPCFNAVISLQQTKDRKVNPSALLAYMEQTYPAAPEMMGIRNKYTERPLIEDDPQDPEQVEKDRMSLPEVRSCLFDAQ